MASFEKAYYKTSSLCDKPPSSINSISGTPLVEVALVGRSNVGKSSLLNHLLQTKKLAKVSSRPGKTQTLNFFVVDEKICVVDLPGYGFAKVPKKLKEEWGKSIEDYLKTRDQLKLLLILLDVRRIPSGEDLSLLEWASYYNKPFFIVFTKYDKLKKNERKKQVESIRTHILEKLDIEIDDIFYSVKNNHYRKPLINKINQSLLDHAETK